MIFMFCNQKYGMPFLHASNSFYKDNNIPITIVMSDRINAPVNRILRLLYVTKYQISIKLREFMFFRSFGMRIIITDNINSTKFKNIITYNDHGIVAGFNQIFKPDTISRFNSLVNFHPSLLPLYRGPVPSYWCLKYGEKKTGFTIHTITGEIDVGDILYQELINIDQNDDEASLDYKIAKQASLVLYKYLKYLMDSKDWVKVKLDAFEVYNNHINYAPHPKDSSYLVDKALR